MPEKPPPNQPATPDQPGDVDHLRRRVAELEAELAERRDVEERLKFVEARRASHIANTPVGVVYMDTSFLVTEWNPSAERIFGYSCAQAIGRHAADLIVPPDVRPVVDQVLKDLMQQSGGRHSLNDNLTRDGRRILCDWYNTPVVDNQGRVNGIISLVQDVTEQRQREARLRTIIENAPSLIVLVDREGRLLFTNRLEPGYTQADVQDAWIVDFVVPEHRPIFKAALQKVWETGEVQEYRVQEIVNRHWYQTRLAPVYEGYEITSAIAICDDVHEQHLQQDRLRQSEERFRVLAQNVPGVVFTAVNDEHMSATFVSDYLKALIGVEPEELLTETVRWTDLVHPEELPAVRQCVADAVESGEAYNTTYRVLRRDGRWLWVEEYGRAVYDDEGSFQFITGVVFDIDQRREAQEILRRDEEKFRTLADNVPGVVYLCNNDDRYSMIYLSSAVESLLGIPAADFVADRVSFVHLFHPDDAPGISLIVDDALSRRDSFQLQYRLRRADGTWVWVEEYGQGVFDDQGELRFLEGAIFDISLRKQAEEAVNRSQEQLEHLVAQRTHELDMANRLLQDDIQTQAQLTRETRRQAEELRAERRRLKRMLDLQDRERQLIAYEIHDGFVQHVTGAIMHLQGAAAKSADDLEAARSEINFGIAVLQDSVDEARRLIDGLRPGVLEAAGVAPAVEYLVQQVQQRHGLRVDFTTDARFDRLAPAVEMAIYRIIQESLNNVVKHSGSQRASVEISHRTETLVIKVQDWGVGFDRRRVTSQRYGLTGIRDRAKLLGGTAKIAAAVGEGVRLRIELPLRDVLMPDGWQPEELPEGEDESSSEWRSAPPDDAP